LTEAGAQKQKRPDLGSGRSFLREQTYHKIQFCQVKSCILINLFNYLPFSQLEDAAEWRSTSEDRDSGARLGSGLTKNQQPQAQKSTPRATRRVTQDLRPIGGGEQKKQHGHIENRPANNYN
jgi:hypothetical protein